VAVLCAIVGVVMWEAVEMWRFDSEMWIRGGVSRAVDALGRMAHRPALFSEGQPYRSDPTMIELMELRNRDLDAGTQAEMKSLLERK
jgi:hypothetical protein